MPVDYRQNRQSCKLQASEVPLNKVPVQLESEQVQYQVGNVRMKKATYRHPPELVFEPQPRIELVLEFEQKALPRVVVLRPGLMDDSENDESYEHHYTQDESYTFEAKPGEDYGEQRRLAHPDKFIGNLEKAVIVCNGNGRSDRLLRSRLESYVPVARVYPLFDGGSLRA